VYKRQTVQSPPIALPDRAGQRLTFHYYFAHAADSTTADEFRVRIVAADGSTTTVLLERGAANDDDARWATASIGLDPWRGTTIVVRFSAKDAGRASLVEAAFDDVRVTR
jgi:aminopeptidase S